MADDSRSPRAALSEAATDTPAAAPGTDAPWTFLSNHCHVLLVLSRNPSMALREVALRVGITERSVQRIVTDLETAGYLEKTRVGRSNHYSLLPGRTLRHPLESHCRVDELLEFLGRS